MLFPHIQQKAQAEIDSVTGSNRLPTFEDRPNLPYVEALFKEVLIWNPVAPLGLSFCFSESPYDNSRSGVPHRLMEDDLYNGYLLPKGSIVIANIWFVVSMAQNY